MALIPCSQCTHLISDAAISCPSCGHPVSFSPPQAQYFVPMHALPQPRRSRWRGVLVLSAVAVIAIGIWDFSNFRAELKNPTCRSDFSKCKDNEDLVNNYRGADHLSLSSRCRNEAKKINRFGEPSLPTGSFGWYTTGDSYLKSGMVRLQEREGRFANQFGAMVKSKATCIIDLASGYVSVELE